MKSDRPTIQNPKYKQTARKIKNDFPKRKYMAISNQNRPFFRKSYLDLERQIIVWKDILIMSRQLTTSTSY